MKWEEKKETNIGLDFVSWGGRLSGSIDYYNRDVDGLIYEYGVPTPPNLYNKTMANGGTMRNRGVEVLVLWFLFRIKILNGALPEHSL